MEKMALLIYPDCSLQEVMNLCRLMRWDHDILTETVASSPAPVRSEEGILLQPAVTTEHFRREDYRCLILPGCSDFTRPLHDSALLRFLAGFQGDRSFPIGAICGGPVLLAKAGLLRGRQFTASIYMDFFDWFPFLEQQNYVPAPLVTDGNITTAGGSHFNGFAAEMARQMGFPCPEPILSGYMDGCAPSVYRQRLPAQAAAELHRLLADAAEG